MKIADILNILPQTQCKRCGYSDCEAYAKAIVEQGVAINRCPPGGQDGIYRLAQITEQDEIISLTLDPSCGEEEFRHTVWINEEWCIGCTLCIKACPVDAILGSNKKMHTVIEPNCTGCDLCIPVCPTDCIRLDALPNFGKGRNQEEINKARSAYESRKKRLAKSHHC